MKTVIIGNGPSAIAKELGEVIDSYECVIRLNRCKIHGFEKFIGSKTDIWVVAYQGALGHWGWQNDGKPPRMVLCHTKGQQSDVETMIESKAFVEGVEILPKQVVDDVDRFVDGHFPSTGLTTVFAFGPCDIIGFDHFIGSEHYYENTEPPKSHSPEKEAKFFWIMERLGYIKRL